MARIGHSVGERAIRIYQRYVSRDYNAGNNAACIYTPSCSEYTRQSVEKSGLAYGALDGTMRLLRCNHDHLRHHEQELFALLASVSHDEAPRRVECPTPEAAAALHELKDLCDQEVALQGTSPVPQDRLNAVRWRREERMRSLQLLESDAPGDAKISLRVRGPRPAEDRGGLVARAVSMCAGVLGAVAGAVTVGAMGLVAGAVTGAVVGGAAGMGTLDRWDERAAARWPESKDGLARAERPMAGIARWMRSALGAGVLASVVATPLGVVAGAVAGTVLGTFGGARVGMKMGGALFRNATLDALS